MQRSHLILGLAVLLAGLLYLGVWRRADHALGATPSGEGLMAPLDDAYIFGQYARQAVHGEWLHYTPGAPISTGVSSWSWLLALTGLMAMGWPLTWAAWALGLACLAWSVHSLQRLGQRLFPALPDWILPALFLVHASSVSLYFQGMDSGLLLAVFFATAEAALDPRASTRFWVLGSLLAFTRPEGQVALPALALARAWGGGPASRHRALALGLGLAALPSLGLWLISGTCIPDSSRAKTAAMDRLSPGEHAAVSVRYAAQVGGQLLMGLCSPGTRIGVVGDAASGNDPARHFPPFALLLALSGLGAALRVQRHRPWWVALCAAWLLTLALLSWELPVGWHRHRYLAPLWPLPLFSLAALLALCQTSQRPLTRALKSAVLTLWLGFGLLQWPWFLHSSELSATAYARGNRQAAFALRSQPPGMVAVEDAGLIAYYGGHPTLDLLGVTDHRLARLQVQGPPAVEAALRALAPGARPAGALLHDDRAGSYAQILGAKGLIKASVPMGYMTLWVFDWNAK